MDIFGVSCCFSGKRSGFGGRETEFLPLTTDKLSFPNLYNGHNMYLIVMLGGLDKIMDTVKLQSALKM